MILRKKETNSETKYNTRSIRIFRGELSVKSIYVTYVNLFRIAGTGSLRELNMSGNRYIYVKTKEGTKIL
jgi:hypothetical protein